MAEVIAKDVTGEFNKHVFITLLKIKPLKLNKYLEKQKHLLFDPNNVFLNDDTLQLEK